MALQIWIPFIGDNSCSNQGIAGDLTVVAQPTLVSGGKIGAKAISSGQYKMSASQTAAVLNDNAWSLAFWIYINAEDGTSLSTKIFGGDSPRQYTTFLYPTVNDLHTSWYNDTNFAGGTVLYDVLPSYTWTHVAITFKQTDHFSTIYINGAAVRTVSLNSFSGSDYNRETTLFDNTSVRYFNDYRVYDHCLSPKEVKEISKALVLHYPLNDAYVEGTTNECNDITWTAYNSANGKYGYDAESNIAQTTGTFQGRKCTKVYPVANGSGFCPYSYIPAYVSDGGNYPKIKTVSFDYYSPCATHIEPYKLGSGQATITYKVKNSLGISTGSGANDIGISVVQNEWNHVEFTVTATTSAAAEWGYVVNGSKVTASDNTYYLYANVQVESKDHATPFTSSTRTATTVYDCSGYSNNGTIKGSLSCVDDSPRYNVSTYFSANTNQIVLPYINYSGFGNSYTISWWAKGNPQMMWGFANGNRLNIPYAGFYANTGDGSSNPFYIPGTTTTITSPLSTTEFKHYVAVGDGSTLKLYVNGVHYGTAKTYKALTGTQIYINGWNSSGDYGGVECVSDFRIYATALSADDIKELYNTSAIVCNNGAMLAYELEE